jgi:hypothetical protein
MNNVAMRAFSLIDFKFLHSHISHADLRITANSAVGDEHEVSMLLCSWNKPDARTSRDVLHSIVNCGNVSAI